MQGATVEGATAHGATAQGATAQGATADELAERYGRRRGGGRRNRRWQYGVAAAAAAILVGWVVWAAFASSAASLETTDIGSTVVDGHSVKVDFSINTDPGHPVSCAVQALNEGFAIVGWKIVSYPASPERVTTHSETVRTIEPSVTGLIYRCWLS